MLEVGNKIIDIPMLDIIKKLKEDLNKQGIDLIRDIKESGDNIQFTCPFHKEGKERKASSGVLVRDKNGQKAGVFHCFTCGTSMSLPNLISFCFGRNDEGKFGEKWLLQNFLYHENENGRNFSLDFSRGEKVEPKRVIEDLTKYRYYHPYMYKRKLTDSIIEKFDIGYDKETDSITFPVWDEKGNLCFVGRRSIKGKFYHYPSGVLKPVYALNFARNEKEVYLVESVFNCLTLWTYGLKAVALLGTGTTYQEELLKNSSIRKFILAFDGDSAGWNATQKFKKILRKKIVSYLILPKGRDVNDLSKEEFFSLKENY